MVTLSATSDLLKVLGDPTRVRLLSLLAREELTVAELTEVTRLSQPRVSTHLGRLKKAGLVRDRPAGSSCFYALNEAGMPEEARRAWSLLQESTDDPLLDQDRERSDAVLRSRGETWADAVAGRMERHYSPGRTWEPTLRGLLGLVRLGDVLDVASGDGALAELIAPRADSITCVDVSPRVAAAGAARLAHLRGVRFEVADMHALPFPDETFDQVLLMNALTYAKRPDLALAEAGRVLKSGGALAAVTLKRHRHRLVARTYGHEQLGFELDALRGMLRGAGLDVELCEVTSRERRPPHFEVITVHATRIARPPSEVEPS